MQFYYITRKEELVAYTREDIFGAKLRSQINLRFDSPSSTPFVMWS